MTENSLRARALVSVISARLSGGVIRRAFALAISFALIWSSVATAAVRTDQDDYSPGSVVTISGDNSNFAEGEGYLPGETVHVDVTGPNGWTASCDATADDAGAWSCQVTLDPDSSVAVGDYSYTSVGLESGTTETGTFSDANIRVRAMFGATLIAVPFPAAAVKQFNSPDTTCSTVPSKTSGAFTSSTVTYSFIGGLSALAGASVSFTAPASVTISGVAYAFSSWTATGGTLQAAAATTSCYNGLGATELLATANYVLASAPTTTTLTPSPASPQEYGTNVTFGAHVVKTSDSSNVTTGTVRFYDAAGGATCAALGASTQVGSDQTVDGSGNASVSTTGLSIATHTILACYLGTSSFDPSSDSESYTITKIATTTDLSALPTSPQEVGTNVAFTAHVTRTSDASDVTSGSVRFYDAAGGATCAIPGASTQIGSDQALNVSGTASVNSSALSIATHSVLACYLGTSTYAVSDDSLSYQITKIGTTTDLSALPASPQEYGTNVTFTAHVTRTSDSSDVTAGDITFYDAAAAATCESLGASVQIGSTQTLDSYGEASVSTAALEVATHAILACYLGTTTYAVSDDSLSYVITLIATGTTLTVAPSTQQYSDKVTLTADITPSDAPGSVQFSKSTTGCAGSFSNIGSGPVAVVSGQAVLADQVIGDAAGTSVCFKAEFQTSDSAHYANSSDTDALTVTKEDASILYDSNNLAAHQVDSAGSGSWTGPLVLSISVKEKTPDLAGTGSAAAGDISNAGLSVVLSPIAGGSNITLSCVAGSVSGTGYNATRPFTCTSPGAIPLGAYEVQVNVTGSYYTADQYLDAFTVYDPSLGFATGGGWFLIGSDKVNFGFTTKYNKNGTNPQGSFIAVRHYADGTIARLKSNSLTGLAIVISGTCGNAQLNGKSTFTWWDPTADGGLGAYVTSGNNLFGVSAWDCNQPGTGYDKIWINGVGDLKMSGTGSLANATVIGGGNIAVPHVAKK